MNDFPNVTGFRTLFPAHPGQWLWTRLKVYGAVVLSCVVGFFFVAAWLSEPSIKAFEEGKNTGETLGKALIAIYERFLHLDLFFIAVIVMFVYFERSNIIARVFRLFGWGDTQVDKKTHHSDQPR